MQNNSGQKTYRENITKDAVFFIIALIVCLIARYLQYSSAINAETGFFIKRGEFLNSAYYIFAALSAIVFFIFAFSAKSVRITRFSPQSAGFGGLLMVFCGILCAVEAFISGYRFVMRFALILGAVGFVFAGAVIYFKKRPQPVCGSAFLLLSLYGTVSAAGRFMSLIYIRNLSAQLIILVSDLLSAMFFLSAGKAFIRAKTRLSAVTARVSGLAAAMLILSDGLARYVYYYASEKDIRRVLASSDNGFALPDASFLIRGAVILWLVFVFAVKFKKREDSRNVAPENPDNYNEPDKNDENT